MQSIDILLVEDNEGDILLTTEALQDQKIVNKIQIVKDGMEAVNYLLKKEGFENATTPHLILLDINLPKLSGHEVLKIIRSHIFLRRIPVVMLSTSSSTKDISESNNNDANGYITKPIDVNEFLKKIRSINELGLKNDQAFIS